MVNLSETYINSLALHKAGNLAREEESIVADVLYPLDDEIRNVLDQYLLRPFRGDRYLRFQDGEDLYKNRVYSACKSIFDDSGQSLLEQSEVILEQLVESSNNQNIKSGELYVAYLQNCVIGDEVTDAVGIFKSENRSTFLQFKERDQFIQIDSKQGVDINKLDKGCIVFNTDRELGYLVMTVDNNSVDALYWKDAFLKVQQARTEMYFTETAMNLCRSFANDVVAVNEDKKEEVLFLDRSINYFADNDKFSLNDFEEQILDSPEQKQAFDTYKKVYAEKHQVDAPAEFEIVQDTVKKMEKKLRNSIKLDTNLEIRFQHHSDIPIDRYLEKGYDEEKQMHYYKVYFNEEKS